jgi:hypothetical protein
MFMVLKRFVLVVVATCAFGVDTNVQAEQPQDLIAKASPLDSLPEWMRVLTTWGQRPEFSRDGKHIYFVAKAWSDVFRIEIASGKIEPMTLHFWHEGFQRVLCLPSGDLLLATSRTFDAEEPNKHRHRLEMFVLQQPFNKAPVSLGQFSDEGPAVDRSQNRIAWTEPGQRVIKVADLVDLSSQPRLENIRTVYDQDALGEPSNYRLETQDFWPGTNKLLISHYHGTNDEPFYFSDVAAIDLTTGERTMVTDTPGGYTEAEGVAPDGSYIMIESDRQDERKKWKVDVYMQPLDGKSEAIRVCRWNEFGGYRSDNPVVSPDGKLIAIQCGFMAGAGEGRGIVLLDVEKWKASLGQP